MMHVVGETDVEGQVGEESEGRGNTLPS